MTLRHAAALALVVWYLVYPVRYVDYLAYPYKPNRDPDALTQSCVGDFTGHISCVCDNNGALLAPQRWQNCRLAIDGKVVPDKWKKIKRFDNARDCETELATHGVSAQCMASDDPRLKQK
jgi:hypothetical protein